MGIRLTAEERFWCKVNQDGPIPVLRPELGPCHLWTGAVSSNGYGNFYLGKKDGKHKWGGAHKFAFELANGPMLPGLEPDHLCRVRLCVRDSHMEAVTSQENNRRRPNSEASRTHCPANHPYNEANTYIKKSNGSRQCRECAAQAKRNKRNVSSVKVYNTKRRMSNV